jgi:hypothetical protein
MLTEALPQAKRKHRAAFRAIPSVAIEGVARCSTRSSSARFPLCRPHWPTQKRVAERSGYRRK